jgi:hypothetical protein
MFLQFSQVAAIIRTGGRWCGFLVIEPLRRVHMEAFKSIARALGATKLALFADNDEVYEGFSAGRTHDECVEIMRKIWGPPQPSLEEIDRKIMAEAEHAVPQVWFSESLASA